MTLEQLINDTPKLLAYVITIAALCQLFYVFFSQRHDINTGLKGKDRMWQFIELSGIMWLILFPVAVVSSLFGQPVSNETWTALELVYFMNLGGKFGQTYLQGRFKTEEDKTEKTDEKS